jgi:uncharacterized protein (DUF433 family)
VAVLLSSLIRGFIFEAETSSLSRVLYDQINMQKLDRITIDLAKMNGEPCIRGLRLTVRRVLEALATYPDREELKREYPELQDEDIRQALAFAAGMLDDKVLPTPAHE